MPSTLAVRAADEVTFAFGRSDIGAIDPERLKSIKAFVSGFLNDKDDRILRIEVLGFTDPINVSGSEDVNLQLSRRRAETIRRVLMGLGVPRRLIAIEALGASEQRTTTEQCSRYRDTELAACHQLDRRVQVILFDAAN